MYNSSSFLKAFLGLWFILVASMLGTLANADQNDTKFLESAKAGQAPVNQNGEQTETKTVEINATARFDDLRIRITHDLTNEKAFTLDLILMPEAKAKKDTLDKKINDFFAPLTQKIESVVFWGPEVEKLELELVEAATLTIPNKEEADGTELESHEGLTIETLEARLSSSSILKVKDPLPEVRPLENRTGSKNNTRAPSKDKFAIPTAVTFPFVLLWLVVGAIVFTLYFRFVNLRCFRLAIDIVQGKYSKPSEKGEVSHFQALSAALSGTVGLGNIAGVAVAISLGGPGATFWMIVAGFLGMSSKFVECTLGVKYRHFGEDGRTYGGPMYYLRDGLAKKGWVNIGKVFAVFFAIMCVGGSLGGGNMFQINQAFAQFSNLPGVRDSWISENGWLFGLVISIIVALVIIGGIRSIAKATAKIVPFMCGIYVIAAIVVLIYHFTDLPKAIGQIFSGAFNSQAVTGGFVGVLIQGFKRAAFSNEAGIGSASIAHSAVRTNRPASEGIVSLLEPFIDTVVVCTMTALVIIVTGYWEVGASDWGEGVNLTSDSFESVISWFPWLLTLAVILFAFSTMITWSYYGQQAWAYVFGRGQKADLIFKMVFCLCIVIGSAMSLGSVIGFSDAMIFAMCFPNLIGLYFLMPEAKRELENYLHEIRTGELPKQN